MNLTVYIDFMEKFCPKGMKYCEDCPWCDRPLDIENLMDNCRLWRNRNHIYD